MNKYYLLVLLTVSVLNLAACNNNTDESNSNKKQTNQTTVAILQWLAIHI